VLRAIILDFNGVVVDDEHIHCALFRDLVAPLGLKLTEQDYFDRYVVYRDEDAIAAAYSELGIECSPEQIESLAAEKRRRYLKEAVTKVHVFPGVGDFIPAAAARYTLAIASGAARAEIETLLDCLGFTRYISGVVAAEEVLKGKPDPEVYLKAMKLLERRHPSLASSEVIAIEDSAGGVRSAKAAGLKVAAVLNTLGAHQLTEADLILPNGLNAGVLEELEKL
jgi:HAD superfamily hydrolase (TIGR01509 family)